MILLDYRDKRPIYEQVVEKLERLIVGGALETDTKMPSVRSLAMELSVNPNTIQRAYAQLEQEGYLYTVSGKGSFVAPADQWQEGKWNKLLGEWRELTIHAKEAGISYEMLEERLRGVFSNVSGTATTHVKSNEVSNKADSTNAEGKQINNDTYKEADND